MEKNGSGAEAKNALAEYMAQVAVWACESGPLSAVVVRYLVESRGLTVVLVGSRRDRLERIAAAFRNQGQKVDVAVVDGRSSLSETLRKTAAKVLLDCASSFADTKSEVVKACVHIGMGYVGLSPRYIGASFSEAGCQRRRESTASLVLPNCGLHLTCADTLTRIMMRSQR